MLSDKWYQRTARKLSRCASSARQTGEGISDSGLCTKVKLHVSVIANIGDMHLLLLEFARHSEWRCKYRNT